MMCAQAKLAVEAVPMLRRSTPNADGAFVPKYELRDPLAPPPVQVYSPDRAIAQPVWLWTRI